MATLNKKLIHLIGEKHKCRAALDNLARRLRQYPDDDMTNTPPENLEATPVPQLKHGIAQKQAEIKGLEEQISQLAERILWSPLCLIPDLQSHRPFLQHLMKARSLLEGQEETQPLAKNGVINEAGNEVQRALELLKLDSDFHLADQALTWLFQSGVLEKQDHFEEAKIWAQKAFDYLPEDNQPHRMVARLIQGKIYDTSISGRLFEGQNAYSDAVQRLERLYEIETERGNRLKAELYHILKEQLDQKLRKQRTWKVGSD
ncbi:MAG: hypothetical protein KJ077_22715 [Anaerolineae bacterium]|nr:hypothetical protein [Anaerolineae bacterium]